MQREFIVKITANWKDYENVSNDVMLADILENTVFPENICATEFTFPRCDSCEFYIEFGGCPNLEHAQKVDPVKTYNSNNYFCADHSYFEKQI